MRRRRVVTNPSGSNRIEKLEQNLDGLLTLLETASRPLRTFSTSSVSSALEHLVPSNRCSSAGSDTTTDGSHAWHTGEATLAGWTTLFLVVGPGFTGRRVFLIHPLLAPGADEASLYVDFFDGTHPQAAIPSNLASTTVQQLYQDRPLLWLIIMTVASTLTAQQIALSKEVRAVFGREAYVEGTRS
ncbi:uncharacterized protein BDW70DRAFT_164074 [Aspergillus foveolatus]|uniref:uncharacterized protein n=1 Tax=Aspergillus foveolatus TaxID=210207 RepID=UPI003CCE0729